MYRCLLAAVAAVPFVMSMASVVDAATLLTYNSTAGTQLAASATGNTVTASALTRGSGLQAASATTFSSVGYNFTSAANAMAGGDYLTFGFSSANAYDLTALSLGYSRTGQGPMQMALGVSINGGAVQSVFTDTAIANSGESSTIDLSTFTGVKQATFFISSWFASTPSSNQISNGQFRLENLLNASSQAVALSGSMIAPPPPAPTVSPVPLPAGLPLLAAALGLIAALRRRRHW